MCGICGTTEATGTSGVDAMNAAMRHRGPDDDGVHFDREAGVALGARRLSIIDVGGGHQPLSNEDGSVWAVLNGEIYNHPSLQEHLLQRGHTLATRTDTEVLVHLYEDYGPALVHSLEGMFSFAVWDSRRRRLLVARDRFGEKPLFYSERAGALTFASELDALLAGESGPGREPDPAAIDDFFVFGYVPGPRTIVEGVRQLPPGHLLEWSEARGTARVERYWEPPQPASEPGESIEELTAEAGRLLREAVQSRMISDVPLGVFLSGGVDSSLIAAIAAECASEPVKTFTVGYDVGDVSETAEAERMARALGAEHHELILTQSELADSAPRLLSAMDQPIADQALVAAHAVARFAREEVTVVVGGEGADELFGGYPRYRWLSRAARLESTPYSGAASAASSFARRFPLPGRMSRLAELAGPEPLLARHVDWVTASRRHLRPLLYGPALAGAGAANGRLMAELADRCGPLRNGSTAGELMRLDQTHWLPDDVLAKADRSSMLTSLEVRTPYLHRELAELAAGLPPNEHIRGPGKVVLRSLLAEIAPETKRRRPKTAFRVPAREWLRGPLAPVLTAQLERGALYGEGLFDRAQVARLSRAHTGGEQDNTQVLWPLLALGLWFDKFRGAHES
jgi:asparagine synthase (glutamine-hydrolysing)